MIVKIIDGTYELFRQYYARPSHKNDSGIEVSATRAVINNLIEMLDSKDQLIGVATDHTIESFRNNIYDGYKNSTGIEPEILNQFQLLEDCIEAIGIKLFPMIEYEADDAMASAAFIAKQDPTVSKVLLFTADKDLAQCVEKGKVLQVDSRRNKTLDYDDVIEKFGVEPKSIPDWLALTGDSSDGFPGIKGWGAKTSAAVLSKYKHIENIPKAAGQWEITVRGAKNLAETLQHNFEDAKLFKHIATLDTTAPTIEKVEDLKWTGPKSDYKTILKQIDAENQISKLEKILAKN